MKKIIILSTVALACLLAMGCKEKEEACNYYAPDNLNVSWTDYNDVVTYWKYFTCHKGTILDHQGDTIRVKGYIFYGGEEDGIHWSPARLLSGESNEFELTGNSNHTRTGSKRIRVRVVSQTELDNLRRHYDEFEDKMWYITGTLGHHVYTGTGCCEYDPRLLAFKLDTLPTTNN